MWSLTVVLMVASPGVGRAPEDAATRVPPTGNPPIQRPPRGRCGSNPQCASAGAAVGSRVGAVADGDAAAVEAIRGGVRAVQLGAVVVVARVARHHVPGSVVGDGLAARVDGVFDVGDLARTAVGGTLPQLAGADARRVGAEGP